MQVVFTQNVAKIGRRGEVKEVKPGFASNYLLPQNLAVVASVANVKKYSELKKKFVPAKFLNPLRLRTKFVLWI